MEFMDFEICPSITDETTNPIQHLMYTVIELHYKVYTVISCTAKLCTIWSTHERK